MRSIKLFIGVPPLVRLLLSSLLCTICLPAQSSDTPEPSAVNIPGTIQGQLGCPGDWQPECAASMLGYDASDDKWQGSFFIPAGNWEYKAALNGSWNENYGLGGWRDGANIPLHLGAGREVKFIYDHETHWITDNVNSTIATVAGNFQSQLGCPGDWQPDCLRSWMQDLDGDGIYTFVTDKIAAGDYEFKVALDESWSESYGNQGNNLAFTVSEDNDEIYFAFDSATKQVSVSTNGIPRGDLSLDKAHWVSADTFAWNISPRDGDTVKLHFSTDANLKLGTDGVSGDGEITLQTSSLSDAVRQKFPHLSGYTALQLPAGSPPISDLVTKQLALAIYDSEGQVRDATGVQLAGALDDRFAYDGDLGAIVGHTSIAFKLWAPTARSVKLHLFRDAAGNTADMIVPMVFDQDTGVWTADIDKQWDRKFYLYEVEVYSYFSRSIETNLVTDPYSLSLSINSGKSQIVNLDDRDLKPRGWDRLRKPRLEKAEDISLYELHVRDFSIEDKTVPEEARGTFKAFTKYNSDGMRHLAGLARAGLTHVHLLPAFDFATVNEDRSRQAQTPDLSIYAPDSAEQQAAVSAVRDSDGFNWGYDPLHFTVPEGSYSTDPDGVARIREFREMVQGLSRIGLRVVMDVVYNHTSSFGQYDNSVLDKIVPGYYHRRNLEGGVEMSSCCANTASEHAMMEKLMLDSMLTWAKAYKVDGFRFDLMGHHSRDNILKAQAFLQSLTLKEDGVDGSSIYLYGEGWNFGEVANDARFVQARQSNMAGTGVGTFNDRLRDAVRGGNPFGGYEEQGFGNGLYTDSNGKFAGGDERATLLTLADKVRISLAGNLADYPLIDASGNAITGSQLIYNGQPTGYTADPQESINYIAAHDNETLFDGIQIKANSTASLEERVRMQAFSNSLVLFAQGVPFIHAGQEFLRSKSMDRDSYNSGDWFNALDFSLETSKWGAGLPIAEKNQDNWQIMQPLLANPNLSPRKIHRLWSTALFREQLAIRNSSPLFRLPTAEAVEKHLSFLNTGPEQVPGLIAMQLRDRKGEVDRRYARILVLFNGDDETVQFSKDSLRGLNLKLHPLQKFSVDRRLRTVDFDRDSGTFTLPGRSTVVFVEKRHGPRRHLWWWD
ncbi:pullulanase-type alpha-1,6-glucosidase [Microbulbifer thermotolerans]|uniref:pullulanase-type alpha-1,6-glucosidase n=1 Tax=Microbulbifer thermotolerans TaxID=252514 RepID=UPI002248E01C|nr:pullulanase-type alpha-1,6-glucosidase [Microbulbifer thermotolerans]MCX2831595.1 pullulanase-type alpha-1,6-glucosidase [Microbulbifer thermotolerans]